jgi:ribulose-phosphate 3-epimerase
MCEQFCGTFYIKMIKGEINMIKLSPSILSADFAFLGDTIRILDQSPTDYIHIDVMDGAFVPNISFGIPVIQAVRRCTDKILDIHLMVEEPLRFIDDIVDAGADIITVHAEACTHLHRTIQVIKKRGCKAGVALNPTTPISALDYILDDLDMVLLMSVNPGFGGATYISAVTDKIYQLKNTIYQRNLPVDIEIDGGITFENVNNCISAGANIIVAGTAIFKGDIKNNIEKFYTIFEEVSHE